MMRTWMMQMTITRTTKMMRISEVGYSNLSIQDRENIRHWHLNPNDFVRARAPIVSAAIRARLPQSSFQLNRHTDSRSLEHSQDKEPGSQTGSVKSLPKVHPIQDNSCRKPRRSRDRARLQTKPRLSSILLMVMSLESPS